MKFSYLILSFLIFSAIYSYAGKYSLEPPIPTKKMNCKDEVAYIYKTDQSDRTEYILDSANFDLHLFNKRDSIRLTRIIELDTNGCFNDYETSFKAAFVYLHAGGSNIKNDSNYYFRSYELFIKASEFTKDSIKTKGAKNLADLAYNYYLKETQPSKAKPSVLGTITDINFFYNPQKIEKIKIRMRKEFKKEFAKMGLQMSEKEINKMVDESVEMMIDQIKNIIETHKRKAKQEGKE